MVDIDFQCKNSHSIRSNLCNKRPFLLHATDPEVENVKEGSLEGIIMQTFILKAHRENSIVVSTVPHKDEEQVKLDVIRSFNSFPKSILFSTTTMFDLN